VTADDLAGIVWEIAKTSRKYIFTDPNNKNTAEALGILCSKACKWEKTAIKEVILAMLEDANFHTTYEEVSDIFDGKKKVEQ